MTTLVDRLRRLPRPARERLYAELARRPGALSDVRYDWEWFWAREDQLVAAEDLEAYSLIVFTGIRGAGKTRAAVQLFVREVLAGRATTPRIFAANEADVDKVVIHGPSGIMACLPPEDRPRFIRDEGPAGVLRFRNGTEVRCFSAAAAEQAVGHAGDLDLYDDVAKWGAAGRKAWEHARASCRVGYGCGIVATTRRGHSLLKRLVKGDMTGVLTRRPTDLEANRNNLTAKHRRQMRTELDADFFAQEFDDEDISPVSPFAEVPFDPLREQAWPAELVCIAVWIDPATSSASHSCEVGVVGGGIEASGKVWGLADRSKIMSAAEWPSVAWDLVDELVKRYPDVPWHLGIEINVGGNMGPELLRQQEKIRRLLAGKPNVSVAEVRTAKGAKSKIQRAGPVAVLARNGGLRMLPSMSGVERQLRELEDEGGKSDRADAFVHLVVDLAELSEATDDYEAGFFGLEEANATGFPQAGHHEVEERRAGPPRYSSFDDGDDGRGSAF